MKSGRMLEKGDASDNIVVGYTIASDKKIKVGDKMKIRGRDFNVIGIADQTLTGPDMYVFMPLESARELLIESTPFLKSLKQSSEEAAKISDAALAKLPKAMRDQLIQAKAFKVEDLNQMAAASWKDGYDSE